MSLAKKLNLKEGMKVRVLGKPAGVDLDDVTTTSSAKAEGVLVFVKTLADLEGKGAPFIEAAQQDRLAWVAYPKGGQLGTDLHRDVLWEHLKPRGLDSVRLISLDSVWSVMRFRPLADPAPRANKPSSIDEYIAAAPEDVQALLKKVRKSIRKVLPKAEEKISYGIPALMLDERNAVYFGAWKRHIGLYPVYRSDDPIEQELAPYRAAKDTLQFPLTEPIPYALIERVVAFLQKGARKPKK